MPLHSWRRIMRPALLALCAGCATGSGAGVPHLSVSRMASITFAAMQPRALAITLKDNRQPPPDNAAKTMAIVDTTLSALFSSAGIAISPLAANRLVLVFAYPDSGRHGLEPEDCLTLSATLYLANGAHAEARSLDCFAWVNVYGMRAGDDATAVYEQSLNSVLGDLDKWLGPPPSS